MVFIEERFIFTYLDYLNYCDNLQYPETEKEFICVAEDSAEYRLNDKERIDNERQNGDKKNDKIFKDILQNKNEMAYFLSDFIEYKISPNNLENYNPNYITKNFKYKQIDILYKVKGKMIFVLVEHQTKVDYSMPYRILNYCIEIIRSIVDEGEYNRATYKYPIIMPIVLYCIQVIKNGQHLIHL